MSLRDDIESGPTCSIGKLAKIMEAEDYGELLELIQDHSIATRALSRVLIRRGFFVGKDSLEKHRKGLCVYCG